VLQCVAVCCSLLQCVAVGHHFNGRRPVSNFHQYLHILYTNKCCVLAVRFVRQVLLCFAVFSSFRWTSACLQLSPVFRHNLEIIVHINSLCTHMSHRNWCKYNTCAFHLQPRSRVCRCSPTTLEFVPNIYTHTCVYIHVYIYTCIYM